MNCFTQANAIDTAVRIFMYRLIIPINVEQRGRQDTALW